MNSVILQFAKTTKNFHKFDAVAPVLGSIYIPKELMNEIPPASVMVILPKVQEIA